MSSTSTLPRVSVDLTDIQPQNKKRGLEIDPPQIDPPEIEYIGEAYFTLKFHDSLKPLFDEILQSMLKKMVPNKETLEPMHQQDEENSSSFSSTESADFSAFAEDFETTKETLDDVLKIFTSTELVEEFHGELFKEFKKFRKNLTHWYESYQDLSHHYTTHSPSSAFLKCSLSFSPSIQDRILKDKVTAKIKKIKDECEKDLTKYVLKNAMRKQSELSGDIDDWLHYNGEASREQKRTLAKAYRVVLRTHPKSYADALKTNLYSRPYPGRERTPERIKHSEQTVPKQRDHDDTQQKELQAPQQQGPQAQQQLQQSDTAPEQLRSHVKGSHNQERNHERNYQTGYNYPRRGSYRTGYNYPRRGSYQRGSYRRTQYQQSNRTQYQQSNRYQHYDTRQSYRTEDEEDDNVFIPHQRPFRRRQWQQI